jgi:hypothetical protein
MKAFLFDLDGTLEAHGAQHLCASPGGLAGALARIHAPT